MTTPLAGTPLDAFLAAPSEVAAAQDDVAFRSFLEQALSGSGVPPRQVATESALYRLADERGTVRELGLDDPVPAAAGVLALRQLLAPQLAQPPERLVHAVWRLPDFAALRRFVQALGAVVRFAPPSPDDGPRAIGQVVLGATLLSMLASVERRDYVLPNGDMASDAVTRTLGLRAKVFALDRARRAQVPNDASLLDRLTRTLARLR